MKKTVSIYHIQRFGKDFTIRFNLAAVRRLLPEWDIKDFNLSSTQKRIMQKRVDLYAAVGGKIELSNGIEARPDKWHAGKFYPGAPAIEPSINHLPSTEILEQVIIATQIKKAA
jgi:hypothetical protein